jgi:hypothetical protein
LRCYAVCMNINPPVPHLTQIAGKFVFRRKVPKDLTKILKRLEWKLVLQADDQMTAEYIARRLTARINRYIEELRRQRDEFRDDPLPEAEAWRLAEAMHRLEKMFVEPGED